jgi:hypothetical protein
MVLASFLSLLGCGCGGGGGGGTGSALDKWLPPLPAPDGSAPSVSAGVVTSAAQLPSGQARSGLVGDYFIKNSAVSFIIQGPQRFIGVVPWGGNVVDAVMLDAQGQPTTDDQFGELSMFYVLGRTCAHDRVDVLLDGSGGGPAVIRARGVAKVNDYMNLKGLGIINVAGDQDPTLEDQVECATTYTLQPGSNVLEVQWTLYNGGTIELKAPFGAISDVGGESEPFVPRTGFSKATLDSILTQGDPAPVPYAVFQSPGIAYGLLPRHADPTTSSAVLTIAGVNITLFGAQTFLDILQQASFYLDLPAKQGVTHALDFVVGKDGNAVDVAWRTRASGETLQPISGHVTWTPGDAPAPGARVGVYSDGNGNGNLDTDDPIVTYFDVAADGTYAGQLPAGTYFLRADQRLESRSAVQTVTVAAAAVSADLGLPATARYDFTITDSETGQPIPCKLTVIGVSPVFPDQRVVMAYDQRPVAVQMTHAIHGTTVPLAAGDPIDPPMQLPVGGTYKVFVSRGPEWSVASTVITPVAGATETISLELTRVVDTTGYLAADFHQHSVGSPDSPVPYAVRLATLVSEGIEFFASTDHDYLSDYAPVIAQEHATDLIDTVIGVEATSFSYGHFMAYPLTDDPDDPSHGAVDWATGTDFALLPSEMWTAYRGKGAKVIQVNHPRTLESFAGFLAYFDVAGLSFDYVDHSFEGKVAKQPVPADWLRLPDGAKIFSDAFDTLEVWNGFKPGDFNGDGWREEGSLDLVLQDLMDFTSFGKLLTPLGNSDSHNKDLEPAGEPRNLIRVSDDTPGPISDVTRDEMWAAMTGAAPRDVVVTDGPMLAVKIDGANAIGRVVAINGGSAELAVEVTSPDWIDVDTIELFIDTMRSDSATSALQPTYCFTARTGLSALDTCALASGGARPLTSVTQEVVGSNGARRNVVHLTFTLDVADLPHPAGATGQDAWLIVRASGQRAVFPSLLNDLPGDAAQTLVSGTPEEVDAVLRSSGIPAMAICAPVLLDVDGGGWLAPFAP